jgi:hypothetical protein
MVPALVRRLHGWMHGKVLLHNPFDLSRWAPKPVVRKLKSGIPKQGFDAITDFRDENYGFLDFYRGPAG